MARDPIFQDDALCNMDITHSFKCQMAMLRDRCVLAIILVERLKFRKFIKIYEYIFVATCEGLLLESFEKKSFSLN